MAEKITATGAAKGFSDLLNRIRYRGESFEITRGGVVVARLGPPAPQGTVRELFELLGELGSTGLGMADDLEAIQAEQPVLPDLSESDWDS